MHAFASGAERNCRERASTLHISTQKKPRRLAADEAGADLLRQNLPILDGLWARMSGKPSLPVARVVSKEAALSLTGIRISSPNCSERLKPRGLWNMTSQNVCPKSPPAPTANPSKSHAGAFRVHRLCA